MPDKKLTDNEIIKTLQETDDYPHNYEEGQDLQNALDLINRLQFQNKDLAETVYNLTIEKDALFDKAEELKSEIERLKESLNIGLENFATEYDNKIKAEAYKEFAERIKEFMHNKFKALDEYEFEYITERDIDNIVKEMVGDDNA